MKQSALVLIKIDEKKDFISAFKKINSLENVVSCNATRGDIDIFLKIEEDTVEKCELFFNSAIKPLGEIKNSQFLPVEKTMEANKGEEAKANISSFILAEGNEKMIGAVESFIDGGKMVTRCDFVKGAFNFLLTLNAEQFIQIDKFISNNLINLNGVMKLKEYPVISIYEN